MKRFFITVWLSMMCFFLLGNVYAWEVPNCVRITSGVRMWFSSMHGDLVQKNKLKVDLIDNVGLTQEKSTWETFTDFRIANIHVLRFRAEPSTVYESKGDSYQQVRRFWAGYDFDFFMTPQSIFGAHIDVDVTNLETRIKDVKVGDSTFDYHENKTRTTPALGLHGSYYPILEDVALRPNISARVNWWSYESLEMWEWQLMGAVDIPINKWWTWTVDGGYKFWHMKTKRDRDTIDINRSGFFVETSLLF